MALAIYNHQIIITAQLPTYDLTLVHLACFASEF